MRRQTQPITSVQIHLGIMLVPTLNHYRDVKVLPRLHQLCLRFWILSKVAAHHPIPSPRHQAVLQRDALRFPAFFGSAL